MNIKVVSYEALILVMWFFSAILIISAYESIVPFLFCASLILFVTSLLTFFSSLSLNELKMVHLSLITYFIGVGIVSIYLLHLGDNGGNGLYFYEASISGGQFQSAVEKFDFETRGENIAAIYVWESMYLFARSLGLEYARYIGQITNAIFLSLSLIMVLKSAEIITGDYKRKIGLISAMFLASGIIWLFGSTHLRDGQVLFYFLALIYFWIRLIARPNFLNVMLLIPVTIFCIWIFRMLRVEFSFLPGIFLVTAAAAFLLSNISYHRLLKLLPLISTIFVCGGIAVYLIFQDLLLQLVTAYEIYTEVSTRRGDESSLGNQLVVNAPIPLRIIFGAAYLFVFPIPVWSGFQLDSARHLFISLNAVYFYFFTPAYIYSVWRVLKTQKLRTTANLFLILVVVGMTFGIALTSLESRHFGQLLPLMILTVANLDFSDVDTKKDLKRLTVIYLAGILGIHALWFVLKVF